MLVSKAARRYALALIEIAKDRKATGKTLEDILFIKNTIEDSKELLLFLKSPLIKPDDKQAVLDSLFKDHVSELVLSFIDLIAKKERASILNEIMVAYEKQHNKNEGIIEVEVRTAKSLSGAQVDELKKALEKTTSKKVNLELKEQPELRGGLLVKIDDTVIDGTIKHKLEQLEEAFLNKNVELN